METTTTCPVCFEVYDVKPAENCKKCSFPFHANERHQSVFIGQQILKKNRISESRDNVKVARKILWLIAGLSLISALFTMNTPMFGFNMMFAGIIALLFIGFGFMTYEYPFPAILIPLILLSLSYLIVGIIDPMLVFRGFIWKIVFLSGLIYGLVGIIKARRIRKESEFLAGVK